jgi:hypothetical protein
VLHRREQHGQATVVPADPYIARPSSLTTVAIGVLGVSDFKQPHDTATGEIVTGNQVTLRLFRWRACASNSNPELGHVLLITWLITVQRVACEL